MTTPTTKKKAAPGKGKRNRLTDLRCAWKHSNHVERYQFLRGILGDDGDKPLLVPEVRKLADKLAAGGGQ